MEKKKTKRQLTIEYLQAKPNAEKEIVGELTIIKYDSLIVAIFGRTGNRPYHHIRFRTEEQRAEFIKSKVDYEKTQILVREKRELEYEEKKKLFVAGAILYSSWGYEQTNIDFFEIIERKGQFVIIQEIGQIREHEAMDRGTCMPDSSIKKGEPIRKKITSSASINLNSFSWCSLFDGTPKYWSSYA